MASFQSTFSIFFLVLINGFFAIPVIQQQNSSSKYFDYSTTKSELNTRSVPVDATNPLGDFEHEHGFSEHMASNTSSPVYNSTEEYTGQELRGLLELLNSSTLESTTDFDQHYKRYQREQFSSTLEPVTSESTTEALTHVLRSLNVDLNNDNDTDTEQDERAMPVEKTTAWTLSSTSTPSYKSQQVSTSKQSTAQDSETGIKPKHGAQPKQKPKGDSESEQHEDESHPHPHPEHEHEHEHEHDHEHVEKKAAKPFPSEEETASKSEATPKKKPTRMPSYYESQADNSKEPTAPTAYFDQNALQNVSYPLNNALVLENNNNLNVTAIPRRSSSSTMKSPEKGKLNQGQKPVHTEEEESNH